MAVQVTRTFHPKTKVDWRNWLAKNHNKEKEIWVVLYKKSTGKQTVIFSDLLDEAICFGWIDNMEKGINKESYAIRFTPRKSKSKWSEINKKRYSQLLQQGLITEAGKKVYDP